MGETASPPPSSRTGRKIAKAACAWFEAAVGRDDGSVVLFDQSDEAIRPWPASPRLDSIHALTCWAYADGYELETYVNVSGVTAIIRIMATDDGFSILQSAADLSHDVTNLLPR